MKGFLKSKKGKVIIILAVVVILIGVAFRACSNAVDAAMNVNLVDTITVENKDLSETIALTGSIQGISTTNVTSLASAKFTEVNVAVGDLVQEGDVLATLDPEDIKTQINEVSTNIKNTNTMNEKRTVEVNNNIARAEYDKKVDLENAQRSVDRAQAAVNSAAASYNADKAVLDKYNKEKATAGSTDTILATQESDINTKYNNGQTGGVEVLEKLVASEASALTAASQALEDAKAGYNTVDVTTTRAIDSAEAARDSFIYGAQDYSSQDMLKELKNQLNDCTLKAPISGVVTSVKVSVGDNNTPGVAVITIADTSTLVFSATVEEKDIMKLEEGMKATLTSVAVDDKLTGVITRIVRVKQAGDAATGGQGGFPIEITIDNKDLLIGMNAKARITLKEKANCFCVPYDHVQEDEKGNKFVMVAEPQENGTYIAVKKNVQVGEEVNYYVEITGGDLKEGDQTFFDTSVAEGEVVVPNAMIEDLIGE